MSSTSIGTSKESYHKNCKERILVTLNSWKSLVYLLLLKVFLFMFTPYFRDSFFFWGGVLKQIPSWSLLRSPKILPTGRKLPMGGRGLVLEMAAWGVVFLVSSLIKHL